MRARSLRWRLAILAVLSILGGIVVAGATIDLIFHRHMERRVASDLDNRLAELLGAFVLDGDTPKLTRPLSDPRYERPLSGAYWEIVENSIPVLQSRSLWDQSLTIPEGLGSDDTAFVIPWSAESKLYAMGRQVVLDDNGKPRAFDLVVAADRSEVASEDTAFFGDIVPALLAIGLALFAGSWLQIMLGLRPLQQLQKSVTAVRQAKTARLEGDFPSEVAPLAGEFNALLHRHADSLHKARHRAGALAHGLKTPLTILTAEAAALDEQGLTNEAQAMREQLGYMHRHVERELARSRAHGSAAPGGLHTNARRSVERLISIVRRLPRGREIAFANALPENLDLMIDPDDFGEIFGNLLDNARKFARSAVMISASETGGVATLAVEDDGPGIPAHLRQKLMQPGERADEQIEGSGLGLAIVTDLLAEYSAEAKIDDSAMGGCRIAFALPIVAAASPRRRLAALLPKRLFRAFAASPREAARRDRQAAVPPGAATRPAEAKAGTPR